MASRTMAMASRAARLRSLQSSNKLRSMFPAADRERQLTLLAVFGLYAVVPHDARADPTLRCYMCSSTFPLDYAAHGVTRERMADHHAPNGDACPITYLRELERLQDKKRADTLLLLVASAAAIAARRQTFGDAGPHDQLRQVRATSGVLASAGFHLEPGFDTPARIRCATCRASVDLVGAHDDPWRHHRAQDPNCPFLVAIDARTRLPSSLPRKPSFATHLIGDEGARVQGTSMSRPNGSDSPPRLGKRPIASRPASIDASPPRSDQRPRLSDRLGPAPTPEDHIGVRGHRSALSALTPRSRQIDSAAPAPRHNLSTAIGLSCRH